MKKHFLLIFSLLISMIWFCPSAYAQDKIDDFIEDLINTYPTGEISTDSKTENITINSAVNKSNYLNESVNNNDITPKNTNSIDTTTKHPAHTGLARAHNDPYSLYALLTDKRKRYYDLLYPYASKGKKYVDIDFEEDLSEDRSDIAIALEALRFDYPEYVWLDDFRIESKRIVLYNNVLSYNPFVHQREFEEAAEKILQEARLKKTAIEQAEYVFEYFIKNVNYSKNDFDQFAYSALVVQNSVCKGSAFAYHYLMIQLGIPSYICRGENHAWNLVLLNGKWAYVDATGLDNAKVFENPEEMKWRKEQLFNIPPKEYEKKTEDTWPYNLDQFSKMIN